MYRECQSRRSKRLLVRQRLGLFLLALVSLLALATCGSKGAGGVSSSPRAPQTSGIPRDLTAGFALLRQPTGGLPASIRRAIGEPAPDIDWKLARRVRVPAPGTYWLAPGRREVCLVATRPNSPVIGTVCGTIAQALHHGIANTSLDLSTGRRIIVGVVPDRTRSVTVKSNGVSVSVSVAHGRFVHRDSVPLPPDRLILRYSR